MLRKLSKQMCHTKSSILILIDFTNFLAGNGNYMTFCLIKNLDTTKSRANNSRGSVNHVKPILNELIRQNCDINGDLKV